MTIDEFARGLRAREITARDITEQCLQRIDELQPRLNAFIRVMADEARRAAEAADRELASWGGRGPPHRVPIAVKDLIEIKGVPPAAGPGFRERPLARRSPPATPRPRCAGQWA